MVYLVVVFKYIVQGLEEGFGREGGESLDALDSAEVEEEEVGLVDDLVHQGESTPEEDVVVVDVQLVHILLELLVTVHCEPLQTLVLIGGLISVPEVVEYPLVADHLGRRTLIQPLVEDHLLSTRVPLAQYKLTQLSIELFDPPTLYL